MLDLITKILNESSLAKPEEILGINIHFSNEKTLNISILLPEERSIYVRAINTELSPSNEGARYKAALKAYPKFIPPVLVHTYIDNWEIIIIRGVKHQQITPQHLIKNKQQIANKVADFVQGSVSAIVESPAYSHQEFLSHLDSRTDDPKCLSILSKWRSEKRIDDLPHIPQHGDFTANNFGLVNSSLVIFDWEDFGRVHLPGFDIFILIASSIGFRAELLKLLINKAKYDKSCFAHKLVHSCSSLNITPVFFEELSPLYLTIFLDLKKNYSKKIYNLIKHTIHCI